ncbi:MAG: dTDP-4-dehydrorhamnose reductase [Acidimicrobiales bacterium]
MAASTRVVITGVRGQLGAELMRTEWPGGFDVIGVDRQAVDLSQPDSVAAKIAALRPSIIVNCAAYTQVDQAEIDEELASIVNATAVSELARVADELDALLIQISTDYVFDGAKDGWYVESDPTGPTGAYGRTKLAGEAAALRAKRAVVLRTAWVYGGLGSNFVGTMLRVAALRDELGVVDDQLGCPTATADITAAVLAVAASPERATQRVYHVASPQSASWYDFAVAILAEPIAAGAVRVKRLTTAEYPTKARRPANSRLDSSAFARDFGLTLPDWDVSMPPVRAELLARASSTQ